MHLAFYYVYSCEWLNQVVGNKLIQNLDWGLTKPFKFQIPQIPSFGEFKLTKLVLLIENDKCFQNLLPTSLLHSTLKTQSTLPSLPQYWYSIAPSHEKSIRLG